MEEMVIEGVLKDEDGGMVLLSDTFEEYTVPAAVAMAIADDVLQSCSLPRRVSVGHLDHRVHSIQPVEDMEELELFCV